MWETLVEESVVDDDVVSVSLAVHHRESSSRCVRRGSGAADVHDFNSVFMYVADDLSITSYGVTRAGVADGWWWCGGSSSAGSAGGWCPEGIDHSFGVVYLRVVWSVIGDTFREEVDRWRWSGRGLSTTSWVGWLLRPAGGCPVSGFPTVVTR